MAQVTKNPDDTFLVTLAAREFKALGRWAQDHGVNRAQQLEAVITSFLQNKINDYRNIDGPTMRQKYDALDAAKQAQVDLILATAVV